MKIYSFFNQKQHHTAALHSNLTGDLRLIAGGIDRAENTQQVKILVDSLYEKADLVESLLETPLFPCRPHKKELLFLASPFTAKMEEVRSSNLRISLQATVWLMEQGFDVYNPLAHGATITRFVENNDINFFENYDIDTLNFIENYDPELANSLIPYNTLHELNCRVMEACDALVWLDTDYTANSKGVRAEIDYARQLRLPILGLGYSDCRFGFYTKERCGNVYFPVTAAAK